MVSTGMIYQLQNALPSCTQMTCTISKIKPYPSSSNQKQAKELVRKDCFKGTNGHTHTSSESW